MEPQEVLEVRHRSNGVAEELIRWKNLPEFENYWELLPELMQQFPNSHLDGKVVVHQGGSVRDRFYGQKHSRQNRREEGRK